MHIRVVIDQRTESSIQHISAHFPRKCDSFIFGVKKTMVLSVTSRTINAFMDFQNMVVEFLELLQQFRAYLMKRKLGEFFGQDFTIRNFFGIKSESHPICPLLYLMNLFMQICIRILMKFHSFL